MLRIQNISLPLGGSQGQLKKKAARILGVKPEVITGLSLARQSIDARKKNDVHYVCTVDVTVADEGRVMARCRDKNVSLHQSVPYIFPTVRRASLLPPVVVGMGPAGLALLLEAKKKTGLPIVKL